MSDASVLPADRDTSPSTKLWTPTTLESSAMYRFMQLLNSKYEIKLEDYETLYKWSVDNIATFWDEAWHFVGIRASAHYHEVVNEQAPMFPRPSWFSGARMNFAENLLFPVQDVTPDDIAVIAATETSREYVTWATLRARVRDCQAGLLAHDVKEGDRVAGYVANHTNALVAMLAVTSVGAIWTAVSPDTGVHAVLERLRQIEPKILFADNAAFYNGKTHEVIPKIKDIAAELPTLAAVVVFETVEDVQLDSTSIAVPAGKAYKYRDFVNEGSATALLTFVQLPPDHPVYILYSSGTTGAPKCIVHGCIGTLLQHKKEHVLHCSIGPGSKLFYFTTCTWMMWHWLVSGLASGATIVLYDGSPFRYKSPSDTHTSTTSPSSAAKPPPTSTPSDLAMPLLISELQITHFGTSAKYLSLLEQKALLPKSPPHNIPLDTLRAIYSTGSPLAPSTFAYVYRAFGPDINLGSITGGTDIISLFGAPSPISPVYAGEIQVLGLGMAVRAWDYEGRDITDTGEAGDLVCVKAFPCQPVAFWGSEGEKKYRGSYFERFELEGRKVWHHGDFVRFNPETGGMVMLGRSDGVLKPAGVRFGSAEIYNVVLKHFGGVVEDALCVGRRRETDGDETVVLFLKMEKGQEYSTDLVEKIKTVIRKELSARHVPGIVDECLEIPVTVNGKKVETAVKQILCGLNVKTSASVANAECLDWYRDWARNHA